MYLVLRQGARNAVLAGLGLVRALSVCAPPSSCQLYLISGQPARHPQILASDPPALRTREKRDDSGHVGRLPRRPRGVIPATAWSVYGGVAPRSISVSVAPGETVLTVMPRGPNYRAATAVSCSIAPLLAAYGPIPGTGRTVFMVEMFTIRPPSRICLAA